jgi:hypothetical protein
VGAITIATVFFFFKNPEREHTDLTFKQKIGNIDLLGAFFLISAIVCLLLALQWGGVTYPWKSSRVYGCLIGFGLVLIVFIAIQLKKREHATLPPHVFKQRTVLACALFSTFLAMGLYTHIYYLPFYFQAIKGTTAEGSGVRTVAYLVSNTIGAIIAGGIVTVVGYYTPFTWLGSTLFTIGAGLLYSLKVHSPASQWIGYQILAGGGSEYEGPLIC